MQQFFFFCTMLIIATQAFSKQSHGRQIYKSKKRKSSEFVPNIIPSRLMFADLNVPVFFMPFAFESADFEQPFFVPFPRFSFKPKRRKNVLLQKKKKLGSSKTLRGKPLRKRNLDVFNSAQCFQSGCFPHFRVKPFCNFTRFPGNVAIYRKFMNRNPNQCIVYLCPVFNHRRKRTNDFLKARKFFNLKKQYLTNLRNKNKRSANIATKETSSKRKKENVKKHKRFDGIRNILKFSHSSSNQNFKKSLIPKEIGNGKTEKYDENVFFQSPGFEYHYDFGHDFDDVIQLSKENDFEPLPSVSTTDLYPSYVDVTPASVTIPEITFKYPYNPKLYESALRNDDNLAFNSARKELETEAGIVETTTVTSPPQNIKKLRQMLEEVEFLLKGRSDDKVAFAGSESTKKNQGVEEEKEKEDKTENRNDTITLKEKIDTLAIPLLSQISQELGKLSGNSSSSLSPSSKNDTSQSDSKKSSPRCSPDGTWTSSVLGVEMTFTTMPNLMLKVKITPTVNPIINNRWAIQGLTLSKRGGPLMLAAIYPQKRKMASFIGQCKMCKDQDLIFGSWTIFTCVRRFTDLWKTVETKLDVLKKKTGEKKEKQAKTKKKESKEEKSKKGAKN